MNLNYALYPHSADAAHCRAEDAFDACDIDHERRYNEALTELIDCPDRHPEYMDDLSDALAAPLATAGILKWLARIVAGDVMRPGMALRDVTDPANLEAVEADLERLPAEKRGPWLLACALWPVIDRHAERLAEGD